MKDKASRHQHVADVSPDQDSSDYDDDFDLSVVSINAVKDRESCEVFAPVVFQPKGDGSTSLTITGKVDTGAMVSCMPTSLIPQIGLSKNDLKPSNGIIRGMSGADLQNCGTIDVDITCNNITAKTRFYITKRECAFILGLGFCKKFKLVTIAPVCMQQSISMEPNHEQVVHITGESEADYYQLKKKWNKHLPLRKKKVTP